MIRAVQGALDRHERWNAIMREQGSQPYPDDTRSDVSFAELRAVLTELTTARQEIAALTKDRDAYRQQCRIEHEALVASEQAAAAAVFGRETVEEELRLEKTATDRANQDYGRVVHELHTLRAQHRAAVEALMELRPSVEALIGRAEGRPVPGSYHFRRHALTLARGLDAILTPASPDTAPLEQMVANQAPLPDDAAKVLYENLPELYGNGPDTAPVGEATRSARADGTATSNTTNWPLDPATCRAQGHGRVACERCGAELVDVASVQGQAVGRG
jgi:hypothetical protein